MTIAAVPSQPTFVHLVIAAPVRYEHRRKAGHRRAVAAAATERAACINSRVLVLLRAFAHWERLHHKPHARPALHAAASVLPRVIAHLSSFQSPRLTRRSSGTPAGDKAAVSRPLPLRSASYCMARCARAFRILGNAAAGSGRRSQSCRHFVAHLRIHQPLPAFALWRVLPRE